VPGRLGDVEVADHLVDRLALAQELLSLGQLSDDLLGRVPASLHGCAVLLPHIVGLGLAQRVDQFTGTRLPVGDRCPDLGTAGSVLRWIGSIP